MENMFGYVAPQVEVIDVDGEKGFAGSQLETPGYGGGQ